ncbi:MerR family transcriptional regulator [Paenibacillus filicis]|uniref:MerR family transcriptional regulator n=1 Tax=Paenibacillus filicis TaxID=669464 RepID=A0ABU9DD20_9BACL
MSKTYYTIGSFAKRTSTTERTLRYYDRKGLLKPSAYNEQGHRIYTDEDLFRLHQILNLKYLDYSLDEIGKYLKQDNQDYLTSLDMQYELLLQRQQHIQHVVATIERVRAIVKENHTMDPELIMLMIHSIQHEGKMKEWIAERLPEAFVQSIFKSGPSLESELMIGLNDLLVMHKQGLEPGHPLVQEHALTLKGLFDQLMGQPLEELAFSETGRIMGEEMDPHFPGSFEPSFKSYLFEVLGHLLIPQPSAQAE